MLATLTRLYLSQALNKMKVDKALRKIAEPGDVAGLPVGFVFENRGEPASLRQSFLLVALQSHHALSLSWRRDD